MLLNNDNYNLSINLNLVVDFVIVNVEVCRGKFNSFRLYCIVVIPLCFANPNFVFNMELTYLASEPFI